MGAIFLYLFLCFWVNKSNALLWISIQYNNLFIVWFGGFISLNCVTLLTYWKQHWTPNGFPIHKLYTKQFELQLKLYNTLQTE